MAGKMDDFGTRMVELSHNTNAETAQIRKLLQPLVVGMKREDRYYRIQSLVSIVRQNEQKVETSSQTQKFVADVRTPQSALQKICVRSLLSCSYDLLGFKLCETSLLLKGYTFRIP